MGLINPSVKNRTQSSEKWLYLFNSEWMSADGKYPIPCIMAITTTAFHKKTKNTKVENLRIESELFGNLSDKEQLRLKAYYFQSSRDLPGATTLYYDYASQHLWDKKCLYTKQIQEGIKQQMGVTSIC